jgi:hypothetical protein
MMEAICTTETSISSSETTQSYMLEGFHIQVSIYFVPPHFQKHTQIWISIKHISTWFNWGIKHVLPAWWTGLKNSPTVIHACRKRRLKWVPSTWGYSWATLSPGVINKETWSSRLEVGRWTKNPACKKVFLRNPKKGRPEPDLDCRAIWWLW